jgi:hypothetical protein
MYAEAPRHRGGERRHVTLEEGVTRFIPFAWHDKPGAPAPFDLSVQHDGQPLLQVASLSSVPFLRAELDVTLLQPDAEYVLELSAESDALRITVRASDSGAVVLQRDVPSVRGSTELEIVLPDGVLRRAVRLRPAR